MSYTVVPLHNLGLPKGTHIEFSPGLTLQETPGWVATDPYLNKLSEHDRDDAKQSRYSFVAEYASTWMNELDPDWKGKSHKSKEHMRNQAAILGNLALWVTQPSLACFTFAFHALWSPADQAQGLKPHIESHNQEPPLRIHPQDFGKELFVEHIEQAAALYRILATVPRKNRIWTALRGIWAGLATYERDIRYSLFWIGLEALFGSDAQGEIIYKLAQRLAFFTCNDPASAKQAFQKIKRCYGTRSQIVHGTWEDDLNFDEHMGDTEGLTRKAFARLFANKEMIDTFLHKKRRELFLEEFVFSHVGDLRPPPPQEDDEETED